MGGGLKSTLLWESFLKVFGPVSVILGIILAILLWMLEPSQTVSLLIAIPSYIILFIIICVLIETTNTSIKAGKKTTLPDIISVNKNERGYILCLLSPSELFSQDMIVSFYYRDANSMERLIGAGHVEIIQEEKLIQVILLIYESFHKSIVDQLAEDDENIKRRIRVKPGASRYYINELYRNYIEYSG